MTELECPFLNGKCRRPVMFAKIKNEDFGGCKIVDYSHGRDVVRWVCPYFPKGISITDAREAFMRRR